MCIRDRCWVCLDVCELKVDTVYLFNFKYKESREYRIADNKKDGWEIQNPDGWDLGFVKANDIESVTEVKEPNYRELYAELRTKYDAMEKESKHSKDRFERELEANNMRHKSELQQSNVAYNKMSLDYGNMRDELQYEKEQRTCAEDRLSKEKKDRYAEVRVVKAKLEALATEQEKYVDDLEKKHKEQLEETRVDRFNEELNLSNTIGELKNKLHEKDKELDQRLSLIHI